jgi:acetate kinase
VTVVLALNPGSSSLKAAVRDPHLVLTVSVDRVGTQEATIVVGDGDTRRFTGDLAAAVDAVAAELRLRGLTPDAVAHRVVHGGPKHFQPTAIDDGLLADLRAVIPLAPLHLPGDLDSIGHAMRAWPRVAHVACFDTGFHHDLPERSRRLPVSEDMVQAGVRRYGFHGLSVQSALHALPNLGNAVVAHLGSGCSVSAVADGRPRHTTMSLTPTGGMVSATRTGDLDPEIVLYLIEQHGYSVDRLRAELDHGSGVAGVTGGSHDMRDLLVSSDDRAALALDMFVTSAASAIAGCAVALDGWDSLVFTGGVGEHSDELRRRICHELLSVRGIRAADDPVSALTASGVNVHVVAADEAAVMDRQTRQLLSI